MTFLGLTQQNKKNWFSILVLLLLGGLLICGLYKFLNSALGAVIMFVITLPLYHKLLRKWRLSASWAALVIILLSFLVIILPVTGISYMLIKKLNELLQNPDLLLTKASEMIAYIENIIHIKLLSTENIEAAKKIATELVSEMLSGTFSVLADIAIMYLLLYYLLISNKQIAQKIDTILPFSAEEIKLFKKELKAQVYSNVIGSPLLALVQGVAAVVGFWIFGVQEPIFWGLMCGVFSFIPFVGSALVWVPASAMLLANNQTWQGIALIAYGALVITNIDNVLRFVLQKKFADVHPLITIFGVILGLDFFGITGLIFGPLLISFFLITLKIFESGIKVQE